MGAGPRWASTPKGRDDDHDYDDDNDIALTAELPTESLDVSELRDVVNRMAKYVDHYRGYLTDWAT